MRNFPDGAEEYAINNTVMRRQLIAILILSCLFTIIASNKRPNFTLPSRHALQNLCLSRESVPVSFKTSTACLQQSSFPRQWYIGQHISLFC